MQMNLIVAATDFSPGAEAAFEQALSLARQHSARLLVVHVVAPLISPSPLLDEMAVTQATLAMQENLKKSCQKELQERYVVRARGVEAQSLLLEGDPVRELLRLLAGQAADLVVMGSTGVRGLAEAVFGSVAQKMVRRAPCSVLLARPPLKPPA